MIINNDCLQALKELQDNSVDLVCTDPPYGYSFMGKDWDKAVPSVDIWKECLRVLKPGAFCFVMSAPRSDVQNAMISRLMEAGFRLDFTPIYWTYASGFPKAGNIGKLVDKRLGAERETIRVKPRPETSGTMSGSSETRPWIEKSRELGYHEVAGKVAVTDQTKALDGSYAGYQPKPAVEVIIVAMKPLSEKTYVDQAMKNGKGITWLDDVRVPTNGEHPRGSGNITTNSHSDIMTRAKGKEAPNATPEAGRFPANLLVSDNILDDHSKFFNLDTLPFIAIPKASKREKNEGLEHLPKSKDALMATMPLNGDGTPRNKLAQSNHHPTVKPIKLMSYLITLGSRKGDTVLDPFVGSGTTAVAAKILGRVPIGIEREQEYAEIAQARLDNAKEFVPVEDKQVRLV